MRKLNAPGDSVQDVFSTCIESYRDAALKNRLRSIVPVLSVRHRALKTVY